MLPVFMVLQALLRLLPVLLTPVPVGRTFAQVQALGLGLWPRWVLPPVSAFPSGMDRAFARVLVPRPLLGLLGLLRLLLIPRPRGIGVVLPEV